MAEQNTRCRGIGALAGLWDRARQAEGRAPSGQRVLVDLDEGTVSTVTWNENGFEHTAESWTGRGIAEELLQVIDPLFGGDRSAARAFLLDPEAMAACTERINDALFDDPDTADVELNGQNIPFRELFSRLEVLEEPVRAMTEQTAAVHPDREEPAGSVILYGTGAAFKPVQMLFRRLFHRIEAEAFYPLAVWEDSLFDCVGDDGALAEAGWRLLDSGAVSAGPPTSPVSLTLLLTVEQEGELTFPLAAKGQTAEQLAGETQPFFLAPGAALRLVVDSEPRQVSLPESFLRSGCVAAVKADLQDRKLVLRLRDLSDPENKHSLTIEQEVQ